jgi:hypothetical protein
MDILFLFPVDPTLEHRASVKRFVSLQFLNPRTVNRTPWTGDQPVTRPLPTDRTTQTQNKCRQTSMSWEGFEPMNPVFKWAKTVHALDHTTTDRLYGYWGAQIKGSMVGAWAYTGKMRHEYKILGRKQEGKRSFGYRSVDWRIILEWIFNI